MEKQIVGYSYTGLLLKKGADYYTYNNLDGSQKQADRNFRHIA